MPRRASGRATRMAREERMVGEQMRGRGLKNTAVLAGPCRKVPRHEFMPETCGPSPMTIGRRPSAWAKPSASPYIVALNDPELAAVGRGKPRA